MKLLFILDSVEFPLAPTPALARRCAAVLAQAGHEVHLLELHDGQTLPPKAEGCTRTLLAFEDERVMNQLLEFGRPGGTPVWLRLARLGLRPRAAWAAVRQIALHRPRRVSAARRAIEQLDQQYRFDAAIAVAAPYAASFALQKAMVRCKKASWQMDPYAANQDYQAPGAYQRERQLCAAMDRLFVTPLMARDYAPGAPLADFAAKMQVLDFPSLVPLPQQPQAASHGPLRCVFAGSLYPSLRTPHFALELFCALNDPQVELVFVGGGWEHYPPQLVEDARRILGQRLTITGPLSPQQTAEQLARADVLLNLGNAVDNQVPSKLFEYFAAGKPVLHLGKLAQDPCLPYLERWPLSLCLLEQQGCTPQVLGQLAEFLHHSGRCRIPFEQTQALFAANTPQQVASQLTAAFQE